MKIMFLISVILILLLQLCNAQFPPYMSPQIPISQYDSLYPQSNGNNGNNGNRRPYNGNMRPMIQVF